MTDQYILIDLAQNTGRNHVRMWRLTFQNLMSNHIGQMTVDATFTNFKKSGWDHVVAHECPWGVYAGLRPSQRTTREGTPVISADCRADIVYRCGNHSEALALAQASIDAESPGARFRELFA